MHWTLLIAMFLAGAFLGTFALLVIGIRSDDRHAGEGEIPRVSFLEAGTRRALGVCVRHAREASDDEKTGR